MSDHGLPVLFTLLVWWISTGAILYLDGRPRWTFRWSMLAATAMLGAALVGLYRSSGDASITGAYASFTCALLVWGWHEISFLLGYLTGPNVSSCPEGSRGFARFRLATGSVIYHELAILASAVAITALTWGGENQVGTWTFMLLWWMRLSAKLNLFLGVPNLAESFLPDHLRYLASFMSRRPMNLLFPVSVSVATIAAILLIREAAVAGSGSFEAASFTFLATLLTLAVIEHWFLVLPLPAEALWRWSLRRRVDPGLHPDQPVIPSVPPPGPTAADEHHHEPRPSFAHVALRASRAA